MYEKMLKSLDIEYEEVECSETFSTMKIKIKASSLMNLSIKNIKKIIENVSERDRIRFKIFDGDFPIAKYSSGSSVDEFLHDIHEEKANQEDEDYVIDIEISKSITEGKISIYHLDLFIKYLNELTLKGILFEFDRAFEKNFIIFELQNSKYEFFSNTIYFLPKEKHIDFNCNERSLKLKKRTEICNFLNSSEYKLIADDFEFINCNFNSLKKIMSKIKIILSIISICDISNIEGENEVKVILNGYKRAEYLINYKSDFNDNLNQYYKIQEWIYNGGDLNDKVGIARNIISISIKLNNLMNIDDPMFASIKSAHEIYLKENVKEYLDVKGKIVEFLNDMTQKTSDLANSLGKSFYNNIKVALTFYGTLIIRSVLVYKGLDNIFTCDVIILSIIFIIFSSIFMVFSKNESQKEIERFKKRYERIKESYNDVLEQEDINNIFKNDKYYNEDLKFISEKINNYSKQWKITLIVIGAVVLTGALCKTLIHLIILYIFKIIYVLN